MRIAEGKSKRGAGQRTHIEVNTTRSFVWPQEAFDALEEKVIDGLRDQLEGHPEARLIHRIEEAVEDMFFGIRTVRPGPQAIVRSQELHLEVFVVDTKDGRMVRRRKLRRVQPITVTWP